MTAISSSGRLSNLANEREKCNNGGKKSAVSDERLSKAVSDQLLTKTKPPSFLLHRNTITRGSSQDVDTPRD